jgi:hypothetical protein
MASETHKLPAAAAQNLDLASMAAGLIRRLRIIKHVVDVDIPGVASVRLPAWGRYAGKIKDVTSLRRQASQAESPF